MTTRKEWTFGSALFAGVQRVRFAILITAADGCPRTSSPVSILHGFLHSKKGLFDGEPAAIRQQVQSQEPRFFDTLPMGKRRKPGKSPLPNQVDIEAYIGWVLKQFFRGGERAHEKPNLRGPRPIIAPAPVALPVPIAPAPVALQTPLTASVPVAPIATPAASQTVTSTAPAVIESLP